MLISYYVAEVTGKNNDVGLTHGQVNEDKKALLIIINQTTKGSKIHK